MWEKNDFMILCLKHMYEGHPRRGGVVQRQWPHMTYTTAAVLVLMYSDHKQDKNNSVLFLHLGTGVAEPKSRMWGRVGRIFISLVTGPAEKGRNFRRGT